MPKVPPHFRQTAAMLLIREHYRHIGLSDGWTWNQLEELAALMQVEPCELLALVGVTGAQANQCVRQNKIPLTVALHLHTIRDWHLHRRLGKELEPVIPVEILS